MDKLDESDALLSDWFQAHYHGLCDQRKIPLITLYTSIVPYKAVIINKMGRGSLKSLHSFSWTTPCPSRFSELISIQCSQNVALSSSVIFTAFPRHFSSTSFATLFLSRILSKVGLLCPPVLLPFWPWFDIISIPWLHFIFSTFSLILLLAWAGSMSELSWPLAWQP